MPVAAIQAVSEDLRLGRSPVAEVLKIDDQPIEAFGDVP
jgi:hypothetical protein